MYCSLIVNERFVVTPEGCSIHWVKVKCLPFNVTLRMRLFRAFNLSQFRAPQICHKLKLVYNPYNMVTWCVKPYKHVVIIVGFWTSLSFTTVSSLGPAVLPVTSRDPSLAFTHPWESENFDKKRRGKRLECSRTTPYPRHGNWGLINM